MRKKFLILAMFIFTGICFSSSAANAFFFANPAIEADCNGYTITGNVYGKFAAWLYLEKFCISYTVTLTNGEQTIVKTGTSTVLVPPGLTNESLLPFSISNVWGEEICGMNFEVTGRIELDANCRHPLPVAGMDLSPAYFDCPCDYGCTLTFGYWKTHSSYGPAPYDAAWEQIIPDGASSAFFLSGKSFYEVLWTPPKGRAYYNLAHQYIAAVLNHKNGASTIPEVESALANAQTFFETTTPSFVLPFAVKNSILATAGILARYNEGETGPGHCND